MKRIDALLEHYGESHQNPANIRIHKICVPTIVFTVYGLLWSIPLPDTMRYSLSIGGIGYANIASLIFLLGLVYYVQLSWILSLGMAAMSLVFLALLGGLEKAGVNILALSIVIFVVAWIGQFVGHKIEGKKPSFFEDLQFLLIGPAWTLAPIYKRLGIHY